MCHCLDIGFGWSDKVRDVFHSSNIIMGSRLEEEGDYFDETIDDAICHYLKMQPSEIAELVSRMRQAEAMYLLDGIEVFSLSPEDPRVPQLTALINALRLAASNTVTPDATSASVTDTE